MNREIPTVAGAPGGPRLSRLVLRSLVGGTLMGLANLVPGISGGTMLLASGIYPRFIQAVGEVTIFKFRRLSLLTLGTVALAALVAVAAFAGPVKDLVIHHRWVMYSLFIGFTLGGVPVVWRLIGRATPAVVAAAAAGLAVMAAIALNQGAGGTDREATAVLFFIAGIAGAGAMILPGISGGYLLLLMGMYVPLLAAISGFVSAVTGGEIGVAFQLALSALVPVGVGVLLGVVGVSNLLRLLLARFEKATLGVLLGLLLGAVLGLWPFQQGVAPAAGDVLQGQTVIVKEPGGGLMLVPSGRPVGPEDYPTAYFTPSAGQVAAALGLMVLAFAFTLLVDRFGRERPPAPAPASRTVGPPRPGGSSTHL